MKRITLYIILLSGFACASCDEKITAVLPDAPPVIVIDAFITTQQMPQTIRVMKSQPYFEETLPPGVSGATVSVSDGVSTYIFTEDPGSPGSYVFDFPDSLTVGTVYTLSVKIDSEEFTASSRLGRVPPIDSITFEKSTFPGETNKDNFYRAQFWAKDPDGPGDTYWIRATKNGVLLNKPSEINIAYDGAFSKGSNFDGFVFIQPIRNGINPDNTDDDDSNDDESPYSPGDSVYVELHSLTEASFNYLNEIAIQTNRPGGFGELFARPLANVSTNLKNTAVNGTPVVGFFNVASVSVAGKKFTK